MRTFVSLLIAVLLCLAGSSAFAAPEMQFDSPSFDFGEIFQGEKVLHSFQFVNAGKDPLLIDRVSSSCGCTAVLVSEKNVAPGGTGEIQANFDSARFRGSVSKTVYIYSNDPVQPVMQLQIKGKVLEVVAVEPGKVNFGKVNGEQSLAAKVRLRNQGTEPLTFGKPSTTAAELQAEMPEVTLVKGKETTIDLLLKPKPGSTRFSGYVLVPVVGVPNNQLRIPVYASFGK